MARRERRAEEKRLKALRPKKYKDFKAPNGEWVHAGAAKRIVATGFGAIQPGSNALLVKPDSKEFRRDAEARRILSSGRQVSPFPPPVLATTYEAYMASPAWRDLRERIFAERGPLCELCGGSESLHLHHLTYVRLGHELPEDLQILCVPCHAFVHGRPVWGSTESQVEQTEGI